MFEFALKKNLALAMKRKNPITRTRILNFRKKRKKNHKGETL